MMQFEPIYLCIPLIVFCGSLIYAVFGFGDALFSIPLLSYIIGVKTATPMLTLNGFTLSTIMFLKHRHEIVWKDVWKILLASLAGIPVGIIFLKYGNEQAIRIVLGSVIVLVSLYNLFIHKRSVSLNSNWGFLFGWIAGILGGALNTGGPPIVIYGTLRGWTPSQFVGSLQGFFLPNDILIICAQLLTGLTTFKVFMFYLMGLPFVLMALYTGNKLRKYVPEGKFNKYIFILLLGIGLLFLSRSIAEIL